jgi:transposase-like protein
MKPLFQLPMRPEQGVCPNPSCGASDRIGVHSHKERRYICHTCKKTFAETTGTPLYGLKYPMWVVIIIMTLRAYGCPIQAIVAAFGIDERTVAAWDTKVGQHTKQVQEDIVCLGNVDLGQSRPMNCMGKPRAGSCG